MALIPGCNRPAYRRVIDSAEAAVHEVSRHLCSAGYACHAVIHGSGATRMRTFIQWDLGQILAGDLDVALFAPGEERHVGRLAIELSKIFSGYLGDVASPASHVSVKLVDELFMSTTESHSLLRSVAAGGCRVDRVFARRRAAPLDQAAVTFPFAIQYAACRWVDLLSRGAAHRAIGLYELAKGLSRTIGYADRGSGVSRVVSADDLQSYLSTHEFELRRALPHHAGDLASAWIRSTDPFRWSAPSGDIERCQTELREWVMARWPHSIIARRMQVAAVERAA